MMNLPTMPNVIDDCPLDHVYILYSVRYNTFYPFLIPKLVKVWFPFTFFERSPVKRYVMTSKSIEFHELLLGKSAVDES